MEIIKLFVEFIKTTGFFNVTAKELIMIGIACILLYLAIVKKYEPLLLVPISFGMLLTNIPLGHLMEPGGFLYWIYRGVEYDIFPPLIFLGVGAMTDFGPLIAYPKSLLLGAAAQFGVFIAFLGAALLGFNFKEAASIGIIGGADGPTAIYLSSKLAPPPFRSNCSICVFIHGFGAHNSAANNEAIDNQKRENGNHGAAKAGI